MKYQVKIEKRPLKFIKSQPPRQQARIFEAIDYHFYHLEHFELFLPFYFAQINSKTTKSYYSYCKIH